MKYFVSLTLAFLLLFSLSCRRTNSEFVTVALPEAFSTFDTLTTEKSDAAAERVRNLMFSSLIRKDQSFDYVGELASEITTSDDGMAITLTLRDNVKFHNGKPLTSADVKYTFDELIEKKGYKSFAFSDTVPLDDDPAQTSSVAVDSPSGTKPPAPKTKQIPHITSLETPDPLTVIFRIASPSLRNQLLSNLVAIPIIAEGTADQQRTQPMGTGPFKFINFDQSQNIVELHAFDEYWEGSPAVQKIRLKTVADAGALQAELQSGGVDIAPNPSNLPPDSLKQLESVGNLKVEQFPGSNIQYLGFNTKSPPIDNVKVRQAIGYAIDREKIIKELLLGQGKIAHSILPTESWAYSPGTEYRYDPARSKQLLQEAGYKNEPIVFKFASGNAAYSSYAQAIHSMLVEAGLNVQIETLDRITILDNLAKGQFQMNTAVWVGGNQDPLFFKDLFTTAKIPREGLVSCCNRGRYSDPEVDRILDEAIKEVDREKAKTLYVAAWNRISQDLPMLPLWYPANMVVSNKRIANIRINPSGDWGFIKDITVSN